MDLIEPEQTLLPTDDALTLTTYGALRPGQAYRLPGSARWYHRSKTARVTEEMGARVVEAALDSDAI